MTNDRAILVLIQIPLNLHAIVDSQPVLGRVCYETPQGRLDRVFIVNLHPVSEYVARTVLLLEVVAHHLPVPHHPERTDVVLFLLRVNPVLIAARVVSLALLDYDLNLRLLWGIM